MNDWLLVLSMRDQLKPVNDSPTLRPQFKNPHTLKMYR